MPLFAGLKRRNVIRVAAAYVVVSWLLLQAADVLFGLLGVPDWSLRLVFGILALGFPVALVLSWIYELTPEGVRRDPGESIDPEFTRRAGQRLSVVTAVLLLIAVAIFARSTLMPSRVAERDASQRPPESTAVDSARPAVPVTGASIAVLPFEALSDDPSDLYFGKGIAEELLNSLARFPGLRVAARTSAFAFEGQNADLRVIGEQLHVAHVLEGSVRRSGERLRVTAQLIRVEDGFHLWSETYDRTLTDVFAIQDDIVRQLSRALEVRLGVGGGAGRAERGDVDPQAYEQYLRGLALWGERDNPPENRMQAMAAFQLSAEIAPNFAAAWAAIGNVFAFSGGGALGLAQDEFTRQGEAALTRALELDPDNAAAHAGMVSWRGRFGLRLETARHHLERSLELAPNRAESHYSAGGYWDLVGNVSAAKLAFDRAIALDPLNLTVQRGRSLFLVAVGRESEAFVFFDDCLRTGCMNGGPSVFGMSAMIVAGDRERTKAWAEAAAPFIREQLREEGGNISPGLHMIAWWLERGSAESFGLGLGEMTHDELVEGTPLIGLVGPALASELPADLFFDVLFERYRDRRLFSEPFALTPFYRQSHTFPKAILADPRYRELWSQPGMAELEAMRRASGHEVGLPLLPAVTQH
jgi:TolB-like protein